MKEILWSSALTDPTAGLMHVIEGIELSLKAKIGQHYVFPKAELSRSKPLFVYLYKDLLSFPMVQVYIYSEGSQEKAIPIYSNISTLYFKEECNVLCT